jgi:hypothetical protein
LKLSKIGPGVAVMFKKCPLCEHTWKDRETFLVDPDVEIIGYTRPALMKYRTVSRKYPGNRQLMPSTNTDATRVKDGKNLPGSWE